MSNDRVKGLVAIVTGAGSSGPGMGNGKASAILYAKEGAKVMLVDRNNKAAKETENLIKKEGGFFITVTATTAIYTHCLRVAVPI